MYRDAYVDEMEQRFADYLNSKNRDEVEGAQSIIYGCSQYHIEDKARAFLKKNPSPTGRELLEFCFEAIPEGLSPEDDGEDLMDEDEDFETEIYALLNKRVIMPAVQELYGTTYNLAMERLGTDEMAFVAACENQGLQDEAMAYVTSRETLTMQELWHWLARMTPDE